MDELIKINNLICFEKQETQALEIEHQKRSALEISNRVRPQIRTTYAL